MTLKKIFTHEKCWRIIPSRYPLVNLFERITDLQDLEKIMVLESMTNDLLREEIGDLSLVAPEDRIAGPNTRFIMVAFTHFNPQGSRFSDGTWGVYYAGLSLPTAIAETKYHRERFLRATHENPLHLDMRVLTARVQGALEDFTTPAFNNTDVCQSDNNYRASQEVARGLREQKADGIFYNSVRHQGGHNIAVFKPKLLQKCLQEQTLVYRWDGTKISEIFEKKVYT